MFFGKKRRIMLYFNRFTGVVEVVSVAKGDKVYGEKVLEDDQGNLYIEDKLQRKLYSLDKYTLNILVTSKFLTPEQARLIWENRENPGFSINCREQKPSKM